MGGTTTKTIDSEVGPFETSGAPGPGRLVHAAPGSAMGQRRMDGLDAMIIGLYAGGMTAREIRHHLESTIGVDLSRGTISKVTDAVCDAVMEWQRRPLEAFYPVIYRGRDPRQGPRRPPGAGDARTRIAVGVDMDGVKHVLGIWIQDGEGASFWAHVCADLANRGVQGVLIVCCDGLTGLPEAARGDLARLHGPHLRGPPRSAPPVRFVAYGDRKGVAAAGRPSLHRPRRGGRPTGPGRLPPVRPGPQVPPDGGGRGRGPGRGSSPSWPSPPALRRVTSAPPTRSSR